MSAYPEGFADWPLERRNAFFAVEAKAYQENKREREEAEADRKCRIADASVGPRDDIPLPNAQPYEAQTAPVVFTPTSFKFRDPVTIPRRQFVYGRHHIRGFVSATVAPGGIGKSSLTLADAVGMASGRNLLGIEPAKALKVWYVNLEDPREEIERRVAAICLHFNINASEIEGRLFFDGRETEIILASQGKSGAIIAKPVSDALETALKGGGFDVFILDPFVSAHRVTENDNSAIDAIAKTLGRIAGAANCAIECVHHTRKNGGAEITAEDSRGASALIAAARSVRVLNRMTDDEAQKAGVAPEEQRSYFRSEIDKANLAPPAKATWYRMVSVPLGNGSGGGVDDQDYVAVATTWTWPDAFDGVSVDDLRAVQAAISGGRWRQKLASEGLGRKSRCARPGARSGEPSAPREDQRAT